MIKKIASIASDRSGAADITRSDEDPGSIFIP